MKQVSPKTLDSDSLAGIKNAPILVRITSLEMQATMWIHIHILQNGALVVSNSRKILKAVYLKLAGNVMKLAGGGRSQMALIQKKRWKKINNEWFYF